MTKDEMVAMLKGSMEEWNSWKARNWNVFTEENYYLSEFDLVNADLQKANLIQVDLGKANLSNANFIDANLSKANLIDTELNSARFNNANLSNANFLRAKLNNANLQNTVLSSTNLQNSILYNVDFTDARLHSSIIVNVDLSKTKGLEKVKHAGPSIINQETFKKSKGQIPKVFLEGCGLRDWEIKSVELYREGLSDMDIENIVYEIAQLKMGDPIQLHNLFISYSHANHAFVDALEPYLKNKGIRFWRDIHDGTAGPLDKMVVRAMENRTVLLIFSENSIDSDWVEFEVENARQLEKQYGRHVLCPIALDASWKDAKWSPILMNQIKKYNVLDFSGWKKAGNMQQQFDKLLKGLDIFYKK